MADDEDLERTAIEPRPTSTAPAVRTSEVGGKASADAAPAGPGHKLLYAQVGARMPVSGEEYAPAPARGAPVVAEDSPRALDELAIELEARKRSWTNDWAGATRADKLVVVAALAMLVGSFLPWLSVAGAGHWNGLSSGGVAHFIIALYTFTVLKKDDWGGRDYSSAKRRRRRRKGGVILVLLGAVSIAIGVWFLLYWGFQKGPAFPVRVRFGFYWTLVWGTGLSYGGLARFGGPP